MIAASEMKLQPYWWEAAPRPAVTKVDLPSSVDVAIIGAGYTGLSAGLTLTRAGKSVLIIEAGAPGSGASARNGGMVSDRVKIPFSRLLRTEGAERAVAIYREAKSAFDWFAHFIKDEAIDCKLAITGRFHGAHTRQDYDHAGHELDLMKKHLGTRGEVISRADQSRVIGTDTYFGGVLLPDFGGLHPGLYCNGLIDRFLAAGGTIAADTRALSIEPRNGAFQVATDRGHVAARHVIMATNGYTDRADGWLRRRLIPIPSQLISTEPLDPAVLGRLIPNGRMVTDTCKLPHYYRPSPDGTRLLFGGRAGALSSDPRESGAHLYRDMIRFFPDLARVSVTHSWSGFTGWTFDVLPHIGSHDGIHYAAGYCGTGVVMATHLGRKLALKVLGSPEGATAFDERAFSTRPLYYGRPWFLPVVLTYYGLRDRMRI